MRESLRLLTPVWGRGGAGQGFRTTVQGYVADNVRQKFTLKERDNETGLDYFGARYYGSLQGRFMCADPLFIELGRLTDPQQLDLYSYTRNNPLRFVDPTGLDISLDGTQQDEYKNDLNARGKAAFDVDVNKNNKVVIVDKDGNELSKKELKTLGKSLSGGEKELFKAITDPNHHAVIDTGDGSPNSGVTFGRHDSTGHNTLDFADIRLAGSPNNAGGLTPGGIVGHETLEAYYTAKGEGGNLAHESAAKVGFPGLHDRPRIVQTTFDSAGALTGQTMDFRIDNSSTRERISVTLDSPIPKASLPRRDVVTSGYRNTMVDVRVEKKP